MTLAGLRQRIGGGSFDLGRGLAYADVVGAWRDYLARDNRGRGVVLVGHSQGAFILIELLRREIEGQAVAKRLVSAILLGASVTAPRGDGTGGTFETLTACRSADDTGCIIAFASYRSTLPPPPGALFGRAPEGQRAICTNPATFDDRPGELHAYLSATGRTITTQQPQAAWVTGAGVETPWVSVPGLLSARCTANAHATYLEITVHGVPDDPRVDDIAGDLGPPGRPAAAWGLHLIDVNLALGNLLDVVARQARAWAARRP